ncbi:hypothetical protein PHLH8_24320 [Pseudomonas sp. Pc102]|uniref:hypothetical protein n=1 Tax=Pseudomonas sp. Pc102 TaxID=2678261 RepID=UPI001BCD66B9|nr:hypothetical protein [Pseudomonas sp. Pc102]BBP82790.1 hypothetical protein PHLH8_24320 [Pseudomonas sp. Pc102]
MTKKIIDKSVADDTNALVDVISVISDSIPGIDKAAAIYKGITGIIKRHQEVRINRYCKALLSIEHDFSNSHEVGLEDYEIEFGDLIQACMQDSDSDKTEAYAKLTISLRFASLERKYRRHFILSLKQLSFTELELLRHSYIAKKYNVIPNIGYGILQQNQIFDRNKLGDIGRVSINSLLQLGFITDEGISQLGILFTQSVYGRKELHPDSLGWNTWQKDPVLIVKGEKKDSLYESIMNEFKLLRIRCLTISIVGFPKDIDELEAHKAIIFAGDYSDLTYGQAQNISKFTHDYYGKCIMLGPLQMKHTEIKISSRAVDFSNCETLRDKIRAIAKAFGLLSLGS